MNFTDYPILEKIFCKNEELLIINPSSDLYQENSIRLYTSSKYLKKEKSYYCFYAINNTDGSIRWIIPANTTSPIFLEFYNVHNLKTKLISILITLLYAVKLQKFFTHQIFYIEQNNELWIEELANKEKTTNYAIYTGTTGNTRKAILLLKGEKTVYLKIPLGKHAGEKIENEHIFLNTYSKNLRELGNVPSIMEKEGYILTTSVKNSSSVRVDKLNDTHFQFIENIRNKTQKIYLYENSSLQKQIKIIENYKFPKEHNKNATIFKELIQSIPNETSILYTKAHGDFTPWNMYINNNNLALYDFEYAGEYPLLFDYIHFTVQQAVMVNQQKPADVYEEIKKLKNVLIDKKIIDKKINFNLYLKTYLLHVISEQYIGYIEQEKLHYQAERLIQTWVYIALQINKTSVQIRQFFVEQFSNFIEGKKYAFIKQNISLENLSATSDIDIVLSKKTISELDNMIHYNGCILNYKKEKYISQEVYHLFFVDGSYLRIDALLNIVLKNYFILSGNEILENKEPINGRNYASLAHEIEYLAAFYGLNNKKIPLKHIERFTKINSDKIKQSLELLNTKYNSTFNKIQTINDCIEPLKNKWKKPSISNGIQTIKYLIDTYRRAYKYAAYIISFTGVDGAGKSTIISEIEKIVHTKYRKEYVYKRSRPFILPMLSAYIHGAEKAEKNAVEKMPRTGNNKNIISSIIRFSYYYIDFIIGQWIDRIKYTWRGKVIIYDRYYFDYIYDLKRMNINLPEIFTKFCFHFLLKPDINILLHASPALILSRKKELDENTILELQKKYMSLFYSLEKSGQKRFICIENIDKEQTVKHIEETLMAS